MRRNTDIIKNIKRVSCRFDMDVPEERRAWQILRFRHDLLTGKKQDYTTILAKAMVGYYDRIDDRDLTNRELLNELRESIFKEADKIRDSLGELTYPAVYPCMMPMQETVGQKERKVWQTEKINEVALTLWIDFWESDRMFRHPVFRNGKRVFLLD